MLPTALSACLLVVQAALPGQLPWEVGLRSHGRATETAEELQFNPEVTLGYEWRDFLLHLRYEPSFVIHEPRTSATFDQVQSGSLTASLRPSPDTSLALAQTLSIGTVDLSWLASPSDTPPPSTARDVLNSSVEMLNASSSVTLDHTLSRQLLLAGTARYSVEGGRREGLAIIPRTSTVELDASGAWIERSDAFALSGLGSRGWVSTSETTWMAGLSGSWRHALTRASERALRGRQALRLGEKEEPRYETEVAGGVAVTGGSAAGDPRVLPTASLGLRRDAPSQRAGEFGGRFLARYAPVLDLNTGELSPRYELSATADLWLHRKLLLFADGGVAVTRDPIPPLPDLVAQGGMGLTYEPILGVSISASGRVAQLAEVEWAVVVTTTVMQAGRF